MSESQFLLLKILKLSTEYFSATYKKRVRYLTFAHFFLAFLMIFRLSTSMYVMVGVRPPPFLQAIRFPLPEFWEYIWLLSFVPAYMCLQALHRNRVPTLRLAVFGLTILALCPILVGVGINFFELRAYINIRASKHMFLGYPWIVFQHLFFVICLQIHSFTLYFAYRLMQAWQTRSVKKQQWRLPRGCRFKMHFSRFNQDANGFSPLPTPNHQFVLVIMRPLINFCMRLKQYCSRLVFKVVYFFHNEKLSKPRTLFTY